MFERADIRVHYEQGQLVPSRHRRYLSNPLRTVLNRVNWNASFTENIPFNLNHDNQVIIQIIYSEDQILIWHYILSPITNIEFTHR